MLKAFVRSTTFANIVGFVLIINLVAVVIETTVRLIGILCIHVDGLLIIEMYVIDPSYTVNQDMHLHPPLCL